MYLQLLHTSAFRGHYMHVCVEAVREMEAILHVASLPETAALHADLALRKGMNEMLCGASHSSPCRRGLIRIRGLHGHM